MECILRAGNYPNLTELKLYNFNNANVSRVSYLYLLIIEKISRLDA
jgi:hypothetical protein